MDSIIALFRFCLDAPWSAPVCKPLWSWVLLGALAIAVLVLLVQVRRIVRDILRRRAADREEARRAFVDVDAIEQVKWNGDQLAGDPHAHPDLVGAIRAHVDAVSQANFPGPTIVTIDRMQNSRKQ
jgi:hypothetical protein